MDKKAVDERLAAIIATAEEQLQSPVLNSDHIVKIEQKLRELIADLKRENSLYKRLY